MSIFNWSNSLTLLFFWSALLIVRSRCPDCQGAFSLLHVQFVLTDSSLVSEFGENSWGVQLTGANAKWVPLEGGGWQNWLFCHPFLTAGGIHEVEEIGKLLFTYIGMLQKVGVREWILDAWLSTSVGRRFSRVFFHAPFLCHDTLFLSAEEEMQRLHRIQFKFMPDRQPFGLSASIAANLQAGKDESDCLDCLVVWLVPATKLRSIHPLKCSVVRCWFMHLGWWSCAIHELESSFHQWKNQGFGCKGIAWHRESPYFK